jgi:aerobic-type carbon monoxide dehydrogenase small subunit (CoxS/CutS family)
MHLRTGKASTMTHSASCSGSSDASLSRRSFLKGLGVTAATAAASGAEALAADLAQADRERPLGPGETAVGFVLDGVRVQARVEPRETLLEVLRTRFGHTGAKEGCDRGTCGACTVLVGGTPVYACMMLAVAADGATIETIEGQAIDGRLTPVQQAFVEKDGLQCGFCTPGVVLSVTALLRNDPRPNEEAVRGACAGHVCRCGSHPRIVAAALEASGVKTASKLEVVSGGSRHV